MIVAEIARDVVASAILSLFVVQLLIVVPVAWKEKE